MGVSIICIKGVSFLKATFDSSRFLTNSVKIAPLASTSTWRRCDGTLNICNAGLALGLASDVDATPRISRIQFAPDRVCKPLQYHYIL